ncbi:hypothetical protein [Imbroritus primus]|uniref:hypothetical protein n=1 Tax=Imbroritus primus TaxID=3058603 RepID=UPI003D161B7C
MRMLDFSSWQTLLTTLLGLAVITLIGVGIRLLIMQTVQQRRERENRQINERLRTLIAAYKVLGGSFTGNLSVDPTHLRDMRLRQVASARAEEGDVSAESPATLPPPSGMAVDPHAGSDRARRVRDAVEAALSDVILLGTEEQVRLAANAASDLAAGRAIRTDALVVSLRDFIRRVLDLDPVPPDLAIPSQGPTRPANASGKGGNQGARNAGGQEGGRGGGGGGGRGGGAAMGAGMGAMGFGLGASGDEPAER